MSNEPNLEEIRKAVTKAINVAKVKANNALESGKISEFEWLEAKDNWGRLEIIQISIKGIMIDEELNKKLLKNNLDSPRLKIEQATNRLNKSAGKIEDFNNLLSDINKALNIVGITIKAISPLI